MATKEGATVNEDESVTMDTEEGKRKTERDLEIELDDDYVLDLQKWWDLKNPDEKNDVLPEIINGKNIADYIDPDIFKNLEALEKEEELREEAGFYDDDEESEDEEAKDIRKLAAKIREKKGLRMLESKMRRKIEKPRLPGKVAAQDRGSRDLMKDLGELGIDFNGLENAHFRSRSLTRKAKKRKFDDGEDNDDEAMDTTEKRIRPSSIARARSQSKNRSESGLRDVAMVNKAKKMAKMSQRKMIRKGKAGESDRHIPTLKPKHLFTGKRGIGSTDRR